MTDLNMYKQLLWSSWKLDDRETLDVPISDKYIHTGARLTGIIRSKENCRLTEWQLQGPSSGIVTLERVYGASGIL